MHFLLPCLNESSTRGFVQRRAAGNPGPVEMTSLFGYIGKKTFPRWVRGTADPSASLGMTKGRMALPFRFDAADDEQQVPPLRFASVGMTLLFGYTMSHSQGKFVRKDFQDGSAEPQFPRLHSG